MASVALGVKGVFVQEGRTSGLLVLLVLNLIVRGWRVRVVGSLAERFSGVLVEFGSVSVRAVLLSLRRVLVPRLLKFLGSPPGPLVSSRGKKAGALMGRSVQLVVGDVHFHV